MYRRAVRAPVSELPMYASDHYDKTAKHRGRSHTLTRILLYVGIAGAIGMILVGWWLSTPIVKAWRTSRTADFPSEMVFLDENGVEKSFPSVHDPAHTRMSVVVPAYNEEDRMETALNEMIEALTNAQAQDPSFTWEVIIIDDGSKDRTADIAMRFTEAHGSSKVRLLKLFRNSGKGAAVRKGVMRARGEYVLMADADGATRAADMSTLLAELQKVEKDGLGVAIGSRAHMEEGGGQQATGRVQRSALRRFLMWGFHSFVSLMVGGAGIKDTQCGFKMFTREAARQLFSVLHIERWAFDVELVFLAARKGIPMVEVPVTWKEMPGSKVDIASASIQMARDIIVIRLCYMLGIWKDTSVVPARAAVSEQAAIETGEEAEELAVGEQAAEPADDRPAEPAAVAEEGRRAPPPPRPRRSKGRARHGPRVVRQKTNARNEDVEKDEA